MNRQKNIISQRENWSVDVLFIGFSKNKITETLLRTCPGALLEVRYMFLKNRADQSVCVQISELPSVDPEWETCEKPEPDLWLDAHGLPFSSTIPQPAHCLANCLVL